MTDDVTLDEQGLPVPDPDFEAKRKATIMAYFQSAADGGDIDEVEEPRLNATDPGWWRDASARIPGLLVHGAGGVCPFQSEGTLQGYDYYFRYRSGHATLDVARDPDGGLTSLWHAGMSHGHNLDGYLDRDEFIDLMVCLVNDLQRAPFQWQFAGLEVEVEDLANPRPENWEDRVLRRGKGNAEEEKPRKKNPPDLRFTTTGESTVYYGWGHTPEEAMARIAEPSAFLTKRGFSEDAQQTMHRLRRMDPTPMNVDARVYPDPAPVFVAHDVEQAEKRLAVLHEERRNS